MALFEDMVRHKMKMEEKDCPTCAALRAEVEKLKRELSDEKQKVANGDIIEAAKALEEYVLKGVAFRDELQGQLCWAKKALIEIVNNCGCTEDADFCMNCCRANEAIAALDAAKEG